MKKQLMEWWPYWASMLLVGCVVMTTMGEPSTVSQDDIKETNRQLKRIADSLEIISGQRGTWKAPK